MDNNKIITAMEDYLKENKIQEFIEYCRNNEVPEIYELYYQSLVIDNEEEKKNIYDKIIISCNNMQRKMGIDSKINNDFLYINTLKKQINITTNVESKINLYTQLARKYRFLIFSAGMEFREKSIKTYKILLKLSESLGDNKTIMEAYGGLGRSIKLSKKEEDLLLAVNYFEKELNIAKIYFDIETETERSSNLEICLRDLSKIVAENDKKKEYLEEGLNMSLKYLKIADEKGMRGEYANKCNNIAEFYFLISLLNDKDKKIDILDLSYKYYKQAYRYWLGVNWDGIGVSLLGISEVLLEKSNCIESNTFISEGIEMAESAVSLYKKLGNKYSEGYGYSILSEFYKIDEKFDESKKYNRLKEKIEKKLGMKI
jgi:hypothetical protein